MKWNTNTKIAPDNTTLIVSFLNTESRNGVRGVTTAYRSGGVWRDGTPGDWYGEDLPYFRIEAWMPWPKPYVPRRKP